MTRRLTLVIHALNLGGAERMMAMLANGWAERGNRVTLITLDEVSTDAFSLDSRIHRIGLGLMSESQTAWQAICNNATRLRRLRATISEARGDCVVSFTDKMNVLTSLACRGARQRLILAERSDPRHQRMSAGWERARRWLYPRAAALVVQTQGVADFFNARMRAVPIVVIPNAVDPHEPDAESGSGARASASQVRPPRVIGVGRLSHEKGFDLLVEAFSRIADRHPQWELQIVGDGPLRGELQRLADERRISARTQFTGWSPRPYLALSQADLFVLPSRYEGFPNALLEAMACGLPAVSFDCDSGPAEIIRPGVDGWLVPRDDVDQLASTMDQVMADAASRQEFGKRAREVAERFSAGAMFDAWERVLRQITNQ